MELNFELPIGDICDVSRIENNQQRLVDSMIDTQIQSKKWLVQELYTLYPDLQNFFIIGSWYGNILFPYLVNNFNVNSIYAYDIDSDAARYSTRFSKRIHDNINVSIKNPYSEISAIKQMNKFDNSIMINTSSEHMPNMINLRVNDKPYLMAVQSNNFYDEEDHFNCCDNVEQLINKCGITTIDYAGELHFEKYKRFMVIGK
ncbi:hypothetical protein EB155_12165 [archaeon]|nr:hypothetical protein [archaeon]NDB56510.1 hypothetical protein [archaeon]NDB80606.1 hypothetical protein [archaeon]